MYFSAKELYTFCKANPLDYRTREIESFIGKELTPSRIKSFLKVVKEGIVEREAYIYDPKDNYEEVSLYKWLRPWEIVDLMPKANDGDFIVGVEVEMGFKSKKDARTVANMVKNWKHITLDIEGGAYPIEATFPPINYNNFNSKCQAQRYIKLLEENKELVHRHHSEDGVGTHINVSMVGMLASENRFRTVSRILEERLSDTDKKKYFGREDPYGYIYGQGGYPQAKYLEFKLFNSTTNLAQFKRYVHIAVELSKLIYSEDDVTEAKVREALEAGYNHK